MRKITFIIALTLALISCDNKSKVEKAVEAIPLKIKVERFDKLFFETPPHDLNKLKIEFPYFFPSGNDDSVWINKMKKLLLFRCEIIFGIQGFTTKYLSFALN